MSEAVTIRRADEADLEAILILFKQTIKKINAVDYNKEQLKVWSDGAKKKERWLRKIKEHYFLVAEQQQVIVGFASITGKGYLDFLFVSKDHQRQHIASELFAQLELHARKKGVDRISSDVSITARPFFEKQKFRLV